MFECNIRTRPPSDGELDADLAALFNVAPGSAPPLSIRACGYVRQSKLAELDPNQSLPGQAQRIQEVAAEHGWELAIIFQDAGVSGRTSKRPGLRALRRAIKQGRVQILIVDRLDRLSRNLFSLLDLVKLCHDHEVTLYSVRERIDFSQSWGRLVLYVLGALAEFYSQALAEEMRLLHRHRAEQGRLSSTYRFGYCNGRCLECTDLNGPGYCPYAGGPDRHEGQFRIPHPIESVAVRLAFEWYAAGEVSDDDVARELNAEICVLDDGNEARFRTKGRPGLYVADPDAREDYLWRGEDAPEPEAVERELRCPPGPFNRDTVRGILTNPVYAGYVAHYSTHQGGRRNGESLAGKKRKQPVAVYEGRHEALVPLSLYRRVQNIRRTRQHRTTGQRQPARTYPLTGLLKCQARRQPLRGISSNGGRQRYYVDKTCQQTLDRVHWHQKNLRADRLEAQVADLVTQITLPAAWRQRILAYVVYDEGTDEIEREKFALRERLERARKLFELGEYDLRQFEQVRAECRDQLEALAPDAGPAGHEATALLDTLPALWDSLTDDELKTLYLHIFDVIYVNDAGIAEIVPRRAFCDLLEAL